MLWKIAHSKDRAYPMWNLWDDNITFLSPHVHGDPNQFVITDLYNRTDPGELCVVVN